MTIEHPKRRWLQFRLRTLLITVTVLTLPLSWFASRIERARKQAEAARVISRAGGAVICDLELLSLGLSATDTGYQNYDDVCYISLNGDHFTDAEVEYVKRFKTLPDLTVKDAAVSDNGLKELAELSNIRKLTIIGGKITDGGLRHLEEFSNLQHLTLIGTQFSDDGLKHLAGLTSLRRLRLGNMTITNAGLQHLEGLCDLQDLELNSVAISDAGLDHLGGLTTLEQVYLVKTDVTTEGVKKLQEALPQCQISHITYVAPNDH